MIKKCSAHGALFNMKWNWIDMPFDNKNHIMSSFKNNKTKCSIFLLINCAVTNPKQKVTFTNKSVIKYSKTFTLLYTTFTFPKSKTCQPIRCFFRSLNIAFECLLVNMCSFAAVSILRSLVPLVMISL